MEFLDLKNHLHLTIRESLELRSQLIQIQPPLFSCLATPPRAASDFTSIDSSPPADDPPSNH